MGECFLHGMRGGGSAAGGTGLNILYGEERPETAEPETVWVSTTKGSGAYVLSPEEPEGEEGLVWFQTGDSGLSVTMEGPVKAVFHLINAYVYLDGSWTFMAEAGVYRDGAWISLCESYLKLYDNGNKFGDTTGGFGCVGNYGNVTGPVSPSYMADHVHFVSHTGNKDMMCTVNRVILDRYSKLVIDWYVSMALASKPSSTLALTVYDVTKKNVVASLQYGGASPRRKDTLDIKNLTGEYYIAVHATAFASSTSEVQMSADVYALELRV